MEILCVKLNLKEDVAGASFLAFGASAPEIVISTITTIQGGENVDVGIGSIIGYEYEYEYFSYFVLFNVIVLV